jgi:hypothetical protein
MDGISTKDRTEIATAVVHDMWPDETEILGPVLLDQIFAQSILPTSQESRFRRPVSGDHMDLMPIIEEIGKSVEVISAIVTLYFVFRKKEHELQETEIERRIGKEIRDSGLKITKPIADRLDLVVRKTIDTISKRPSSS